MQLSYVNDDIQNLLPTNNINVGIKPPMKVLLVEDSFLLRNVIKENLADCQEIEVEHFAATQGNAISLLGSKQFDMLLVDIDLAQGNGFEVVKYTQKPEYPFKQPVIIMLTNHAYPYYELMAKQLGVNYFFDKSMEFDLAIETITNEAIKFTSHH